MAHAVRAYRSVWIPLDPRLARRQPLHSASTGLIRVSIERPTRPSRIFFAWRAGIDSCCGSQCPVDGELFALVKLDNSLFDPSSQFDPARIGALRLDPAADFELRRIFWRLDVAPVG